jgi:hypothetical protein
MGVTSTICAPVVLCESISETSSTIFMNGAANTATSWQTLSALSAKWRLAAVAKNTYVDRRK